MIINNLMLSNFRNYENSFFEFGNGVNIITGKNGAGKTNLMEAVYMLTGLRSWRSIKKAQLIRWEQSTALIKGNITSRGREFQESLKLPVSGKSIATVNNVVLKRQGELSNTLRCVLFSPEDLYIVKAGAENRREFLDEAICQLRPRYGELLARYNRILISKNRVLKIKDGREKLTSLLPEYDAQLAAIGAALIGYRRNFITALFETAAAAHMEISGGAEELFLDYKAPSCIKDVSTSREIIESWLLEQYEKGRKTELEAGACLYGIHRDDMEIAINGKSARAYASQGQTRSAILSLRFGQREIYFREGGEYPVLLLDDVLSELDKSRRDFISSHSLGGQSIITCCEQADAFTDGDIIEISGES